MGRTQLTNQPDLSGGYNPTTDPLKTKPSEWIVATNAIVSKPGGDANTLPTNIGSVVGRPLMRVPPSASAPTFGYTPAIPGRFSVAKLDNSEPWIFTQVANSNIYYATPISQGNNCIEIDNHGINNPSLILNKSLDISSVYQGPEWNLVVDQISTTTTTNAGTIIVNFNDINGNQATYEGTIVGSSSGVLIIPFLTVSSSFDPTKIILIELIVIQPSGSPTTTLKFSDLRFENSFSIISPITCASAFGQGTTAITTEGAVITNLTGTSVMAVSQDALLIGIYPFSYWIKIKTGLSYLPIVGADNPIEGTRVYFAEYPNPSNPQENIMGISDGVDNCFTYNPNAQIGYQFSDLIAVQNNVQTVVPSAFPSSGTYYLALNGTPIPNALNWNDPSTTIQAELASIVGVGNVEVSGFLGSQSAGNPSGFTVTFGGVLSGFNPGTLTVETSPNPSTLEDISGNPITLTISSVSGSVVDATPASGSYQYLFEGTYSAILQWNATALQVSNALNAMGTIISAGGVTVTGDLTPKFVIVFNDTSTTYPALTVISNQSDPLKDSAGNNIFVSDSQVAVVTPAVNQVFTFAEWFLSNDQAQPITYTRLAGYALNLPTTYIGPLNLSPSSSLVDQQANLTAAGVLAGVPSGNLVLAGGYGQLSPISGWTITVIGQLLPSFTFGDAMYNGTPPAASGMEDWKSGGGTPLGQPVFTQTTPGNLQYTTTTVTTTFQVSPAQDSVWRYVETHKNIMFVSGNDSLPMTVRPSAIDNYTDFDSEGDDDVTLNGVAGERVTGTWDMDDYLLIGTNKAIQNLYGSNPDSTTGDFNLIRSKSLVGPIERGAGIRVGAGFYFYDGDDIYVYDGQESTTLTKGKLKSLLSQIDPNQKRAVTVSYNSQRNILIWGLPIQGDSVTDLPALTFSLDTGSWGFLTPGGFYLSETDGVYTLSEQSVNITAPQYYCGVDLNSDGSTIRPVFFAFGKSPFEFDPPYGTSANFADSITWLSAFNFCKSPQVVKDFMRVQLQIQSVEGVDDPTGITLFFMSDGNMQTVRQVIPNVQPRNGRVDVLLTGVAGQSIAIGVQAGIGTADNSPIEISSYLVYWQAMEDL